MFDQENYESDEEDTTIKSKKNPKALAPSTGSQFNQLTGEGDNLVQLMKDRGLEVSDKQVHKLKTIKNKSKQTGKPNKPKAGFFDGGNTATIEQLQKALKKSIASADPNQASCILSYLLEKKNLPKEDRNKYGSMKCNILYRMGAYDDCISKAEEQIKVCTDSFSLAVFHNLLTKCQMNNSDKILTGYMHLMRAKAQIKNAKDLQEKTNEKKENDLQQLQMVEDDFIDSEVDVVYRQISQTELQYNLKMSKYKNKCNMLTPHYQIFKNRYIKQISCGDYHALFLVENSLLTTTQALQNRNEVKNEVFGVGENTEGQIRGVACSEIFKEPHMVAALSGKNIQGIYAFKESSLAYDGKGNIYEWGVKENKNGKVDLAYQLKEELVGVEKGMKHYAALTKNKKLYVWGVIQVSGMNLVKESMPRIGENLNNIDVVSFACGNSHVMAVDIQGNGYSIGENKDGQLSLEADRNSKNFKKIDGTTIMGPLKTVFCVQDCSFFVNKDEEVFFCGKHSDTKQSQQKIRQAQFSAQLDVPLHIGGIPGNFHVTNNRGEIYRWRVDNSVKFKQDQTQQNKRARAVYNMRGDQFYYTSTVEPSCCNMERLTTTPTSYESIRYKLNLRDRLGPYNTQFLAPLRLQIFFSTYKVEDKELFKNNQECLAGLIEMEEYGISNSAMKVHQFFEMRLVSFDLVRNDKDPSFCDFQMVIDRSGRYYFYAMLDDQKLFLEELNVEISQKEKELEEKMKEGMKKIEEERKKNAELDREKKLAEKLRKQAQEEQRKKQTQRRAEEALKKHMMQKEQLRQRLQLERKRRAEMQTGGGFDLSKMKKKE